MFSGNNRKSVYSKADDAASSREERINRLKYELREHIRFLADYEIMGTEWLRMAESLHQIANVAFMETHLPPTEENPLLQHGKKNVGTLWDQERDELAIRILLEEGKLNLVLRILHKYKCMQREDGTFDRLVKKVCEQFKSDVVAVTERCRVFEQSIGILLKFALQHVEAVQIMDVPQFIQHVAEVLTDCNASEKKTTGVESEKLQETLVIHYLASVAVKLEDMDEDRVMDLMEQYNLIPLFVSHLHKHYLWYKLETLEAAAKFLNGVMNSEAYQTERDRFVPDKNCKKQLVGLKGYFVQELVTVYGLKKKEVQTLLDELVKFERVVGPAVVTPLKPKTQAVPELKEGFNKGSKSTDEKKEKSYK